MPANFPAIADLTRFLPETLLIIFGTFLMVLDGSLPKRSQNLFGHLTLLALAAALGASIYAGSEEGPAFGGMLVVDGFATFFRLLVIGAGIIGTLVAGTLGVVAAARRDRLFDHVASVIALTITALPDVLPPADASWLDARALAEGYINLLGTGLAYADLITTVSPTYAREIQTPEYGMGLENVLRARSASIVGILNGVDYDDWDPRHDRFLPRHFGPDQLAVKAELKKQLLQRLNLNTAKGTALIGMVSRMVEQKGFDLLLEALPRLIAARDFNLVVLGSGEPRYEQFCARLQQLFPARVHFRAGYDNEFAHWIEAASDMFLMPSRYEPCGLNQMYSLRYGTVPIVRRTGGLADSVQHFDPKRGEGTGIVFNDYDVGAVVWAVGTALDFYQNASSWQKLVRNGMAQDFSWSRQVPLYVQAYERLLQS